MADEQEYRSACENAAVFDLLPRGKIEVAGKDAAAFLHNLCTNDVKSLAVGAGCEAFFCTPKAKAIAHTYLGRFQSGDHDVFWLDLEPGLADKLFNHLNHYLISEQVELADRTQELSMLHLAGPQSPQIIERLLAPPAPELAELHHVARPWKNEPIRVRRHRPLGLPGFDLICKIGVAAELTQSLTDAGAVLAGNQTFEVLRVEAGTPIYGADIDDNRLVFEVGRTQQAISYTKGCYLGQEPIVMARDRGHINRTLLGVKIAGKEPLAPGARLLQNGTEVGQVTSSVYSPRLGQAIALAYLRRGSQEPGLVLEVENQRQATVANLPFVPST